MDPFKSIAVPVKRRDAIAKARRAGRPTPPDDAQVGGSVGDFRRHPSPAAPRTVHRYRVGQQLGMSRGSRDIQRSAAMCTVVALVPHESGPLLYRVRSETESFERIVEETDLAPSDANSLE